MTKMTTIQTQEDFEEAREYRRDNVDWYEHDNDETYMQSWISKMFATICSTTTAEAATERLQDLRTECMKVASERHAEMLYPINAFQIELLHQVKMYRPTDIYARDEIDAVISLHQQLISGKHVTADMYRDARDDCSYTADPVSQQAIYAAYESAQISAEIVGRGAWWLDSEQKHDMIVSLRSMMSHVTDAAGYTTIVAKHFASRCDHDRAARKAYERIAEILLRVLKTC